MSEKHLVAREAAVRLALFTGTFTGSFEFVRCALRRARGVDDAVNVSVAGFVSGASLLLHHGDHVQRIGHAKVCVSIAVGA